MTTILHTADVHLDRAYSGVGMTAGIAAARREELRDGLRRFVDLALELGVDAVTIGGDLYEHDRATLDTGNFLRQQFERLGAVPVLIAPGNHDPVLPDSLYRRIEWTANVTIFWEPRLRAAQLAGGVTVWGAGHNAPDLRENLIDGFRVPAQGAHVLLFHGSDLTTVPEGKPVHCGFYPADVERTGAVYALLGHYHSARLHPLFAYPGTPEALDFSEGGEHGVLRLDVDAEGARPQLIPCGRVRYETRRLDLGEATSSDEVRAQISALGDREAIVRVVLEGELSTEVEMDVGGLYNACAERFAYLDIVDKTQPAWDLEEIGEESTTKGAFVRLMRAKIGAGGDGVEVARLALAMGLQAFDRREVRVP